MEKQQIFVFYKLYLIKMVYLCKTQFINLPKFYKIELI